MANQTHSVRVSLNVYDPEGLHAAAYAAYTKGGATREEAEAHLGTEQAPNLTRCLVELWSEYCPAEAGYEFINWD